MKTGTEEDLQLRELLHLFPLHSQNRDIGQRLPKVERESKCFTVDHAELPSVLCYSIESNIRRDAGDHRVDRV